MVCRLLLPGAKGVSKFVGGHALEIHGIGVGGINGRSVRHGPVFLSVMMVVPVMLNCGLEIPQHIGADFKEILDNAAVSIELAGVTIRSVVPLPMARVLSSPSWRKA